MRHALKLLVPTIAASLLIAACGSSSSSKTTNTADVSETTATETTATETSSAASTAGSAGVVKTASISSLGTVLVSANGMTLYHLSGEKNGKFICTSTACVGAWHPVTTTSASVPTGVSSLGVVKRPGGTLQVTYKGEPLYTFTADQKPGEDKGQGIKDVGTWSVVTVGSSAAAPSGSSEPAASSAPATTAPTETSEPSSGGSGGYGY